MAAETTFSKRLVGKNTLPRDSARWARLLDVWLILLLGLAVSWLVPNFATSYNLGNLLAQCSVLGIVAIGQYLVVAFGEFDLSVGAVLAACSVIFVLTLPLGLVPAFGLVVAAGAMFGAINGFMTTYGRIPSLIVTLATLSIARGLAFTLTETSVRNRDPVIAEFGNTWFYGIPAISVVWLATATIVGGAIWLSGLQVSILAVGGGSNTARGAGVAVRKIKIAVFVAAGCLVALASIVFVARTRSGIPQGGEGLELQSIAAIVIGGVRLFGGQGSLTKAMVGVIIFVLVRNVLSLLGVNPFLVDLVTAGIILLAVGARTIGQPREV